MPSRAKVDAPVRLFKRQPALPGVGLLRLTLGGSLSRAVPHQYGTVFHLEGESAWLVNGKAYATRPGSVGVKVPGELYAEQSRVGRSRFDVLVYDDSLIEEARLTLGRRPGSPRPQAFDGLADARVASLLRLHRAMVNESESPETLEQLLTRALSSVIELTSTPQSEPERTHQWGGAVRRARTLLDENLSGIVTLDELAAYAGLDKFRLCRAFHEQVGLPPYAYLTHRRVSLAQKLLSRGMPQAQVALEVGLYDQSQLHRHFKRIVGVTPGEFVKAMR